MCSLRTSANAFLGVLVIKQAWPSMARSVWGSHKRYMDVYLNVYPGYYFTGDGAARDKDGYYWVRGRVDDVVNVSHGTTKSIQSYFTVKNHADIT